MNLYTILIHFEDRTTGIGQFKAESPEEALFEFINRNESLMEYDRSKILSIVRNRFLQRNLLIHIADNFKGFWILDFGIEFIEDESLAPIFGGYIIQTDLSGPIRKN